MSDSLEEDIRLVRTQLRKKRIKVLLEVCLMMVIVALILMFQYDFAASTDHPRGDHDKLIEGVLVLDTMLASLSLIMGCRFRDAWLRCQVLKDDLYELINGGDDTPIPYGEVRVSEMLEFADVDAER